MPTKLAPLRKVMSESVEVVSLPSGATYNVDVETLECGHKVRRKSDAFGPTNAYRRRCRFCRKADEQSER